jgi:hypothetical protein
MNVSKSKMHRSLFTLDILSFNFSGCEFRKTRAFLGIPAIIYCWWRSKRNKSCYSPTVAHISLRYGNSKKCVRCNAHPYMSCVPKSIYIQESIRLYLHSIGGDAFGMHRMQNEFGTRDRLLFWGCLCKLGFNCRFVGVNASGVESPRCNGDYRIWFLNPPCNVSDYRHGGDRACFSLFISTVS